MKLFPFLSLSLCRSGSLKARLCSTWSAASAWTVRPRRALWSSRSVAPRWPASPGSHKSSPEPQRTGGDEGEGGRERSRIWTRPAERLWGWGRGGGSHLHTVWRLAEEWKEWELYFCDVNFKLSCSSRLGDKSVRRKRYEASSRAFCVQCFIPLEDAAVLLRNLSFSLKTVAHLTFHFLSLSWSTICLIIGVASLETTLKECILYCSKCVEVHLTYSEFKSHCLSCGLVLGWGMSDDGVDQGSFMYSQLKSQLFFFFFYCWKAVLKAPCKALSGTLFIVLHGQTQRMFVFFFCLSTKFYVNIRSRYWLGFGVKYSICCLKNKMW